MTIDEEIEVLLDNPETLEILAYNIANRRRMSYVAYGEQSYHETTRKDTRKNRYKRKGRDHYDNKVIQGKMKK